jgi:corrinoid protein of di/trimethylamine methyltransferase
MSEQLFSEMAKAIIEGEPELAGELANRAIEAQIDPLEIINRGFNPGMTVVGEQFSSGDCFLPDLVRAGEAMKVALRELEPELLRRGQERENLGTVVIGTVSGDIHEIGKSLVATMLSANGFKVYDLGVNVKAGTFVEKVRELKPTLLGLSALLTTTMQEQRAVVRALQAAGVRDGVRIIVGGAPVDRAWANEIGADGFAENASAAVAEAKRLAAPAREAPAPA